MIRLVLIVVLLLSGCSGTPPLPEPTGPYEPLNGWDPNAPPVTQPVAAGPVDPAIEPPQQPVPQ